MIRLPEERGAFAVRGYDADRVQALDQNEQGLLVKIAGHDVHASCPYPKAANELFSAFSAASESGSELMTQHSPARVPLMY